MDPPHGVSQADNQRDRPNVLSVLFVPAVRTLAIRSDEDDLSQLFPEAMFPACPEGGDSLEGSMELLKKGLESGTVLIQFEVRGSQGWSLQPVTVLLYVTQCELSRRQQSWTMALSPWSR